jgi:hypothetical protein
MNGPDDRFVGIFFVENLEAAPQHPLSLTETEAEKERG